MCPLKLPLNLGWRCIIGQLLLFPVINSSSTKFRKLARFFFSNNLQCHNRQNLSGIEPLSAKRPVYCSEFSCNNATASRITYCISTILSQHGASPSPRRYLGCYTGNMRHNLIPNARPSEMVQQNLFILYSKHIVVHDRNFWYLQHCDKISF